MGKPLKFNDVRSVITNTNTLFIFFMPYLFLQAIEQTKNTSNET